MTTPPAAPPSATPPGWYPAGDVLRWWDGRRWTDHVASPTSPPPRPPRSQRRRITMGLVWGAGLLLLAVAVFSGGGYVLVGGVGSATETQATVIDTLSLVFAMAGLVGGALYGGRR